MNKRLWFKAKEYGWGWYPVTWQGWGVLALYVLIMVGIFPDVEFLSHLVNDSIFGIWIPALAATSFLMIICYLTGEKPGWRWGNKQK